jgi:hypothetical protein
MYRAMRDFNGRRRRGVRGDLLKSSNSTSDVPFHWQFD